MGATSASRNNITVERNSKINFNLNQLLGHFFHNSQPTLNLCFLQAWERMQINEVVAIDTKHAKFALATDHVEEQTSNKRLLCASSIADYNALVFSPSLATRPFFQK
ncbi:hypothetical protein ACJX0J_023322 [Zea mays]